MRLSHEDQAKITRGLGLKGVVTDLLTGRRWRVYGMACESPNCACDARVVPVRRKWIQGALKRSTKGALHRQLGIPSDERIPADVLSGQAANPGNLGVVLDWPRHCAALGGSGKGSETHAAQ